MLAAGLSVAVVARSAAQTPGIVLSETALEVTEGSSASYTVKLATEPSAEVTVSLGGASGTDLSLNKTSLTFTTSDYNTEQTVTVSAAGDDDATHDSATLTHTASGGDYGSVSANLSVKVTDTTRLSLEALVETVPEGESRPIRAKLPMPLDEEVTVTVAVTPNGGRADEYELSANTTLTIAAGATESTGEVTFTSLDDFTNTGTRYFTATLTADHARVESDREDFAVVDDDKNITGWRVSPPTIFENGGEATLLAYKWFLHEGVVKMTVSAEPADRVTLSGTTLTFQPGATYADESLTITAVDNAADEPDQTVRITATVTQGRGIRLPPPLDLTITDDEGSTSPEVALVLKPPRVREGLVSTVTAVASGPLDAEATITVAAAPGHADTRTDDYALSGNTVLTIPAGKTRSTGTVTIAAVDDALSGGSRRRVVTVSGTVSGGGDVADPADRTLTILEDDDQVEVHLIATPATIPEGEASTITMRAVRPVPADVTVTVTANRADAVELSANPVLMIPKGETESTGVVTLTALNDADTRNEVVSVRGSLSDDSPFVRLMRTQVYTVDDDAAAPRVVVSPVPIQVLEGGASEITAYLTQTVSDDVTVTIEFDPTDNDHTAPADEYTVGANRTLTITAGNKRSTDVIALATVDDEYYGGRPLKRVVWDVASVTGMDQSQVIEHGDWIILEDEPQPRVTLKVAPASISESGGRSTVTASLNTPMESDVEMTVAAAPVGTARAGDFTQTGTRLTIPADSRSSTGTVTISAVDDDVDGPDRNLVVTAKMVDVVGMEESGLVWFPRAEGLTIRDDDESGLVVRPSSLTVDEGDEGAYTVQLKSRPSGTVAVSVSGMEGTDLTLSSRRLTFAPSNWSAPQTVTVTAAQDEDASDDMELLTHTASRPEYGAFALPVTVNDDDGDDGGGEGSQRIKLEVEPKRVREDGGTTPVTVEADLGGGPRGSETMVTVTIEEQPDEYIVSPSTLEMMIPAGMTSVEGIFLLTPIDDYKVERDYPIGVNGTNGPEGIPVSGATVTLVDEDGGANRPPTFDTSSHTFDLAENLSGRHAPVLLGTVSARDPDGDPFHYALLAGDRERFTVSGGSGTVNYIGQGEDFESGPRQFDLRVLATDGRHQAAASVAVRVLDVPEPPEAADDEAETPEDTPAVIDVLANDRDPEDDDLRIASVAVPEHGTATVVSGGIRYAPDLNWHGTDRFTYTVSDAGGLTATATVTVTVTPVNDPPEAVDDEVETLEDVPSVVDVLANDTDVDGDPLQVVSVGPAAHGLAVAAEGGVRYAPDLNWYGTDRFTYTIADPAGLTATATVTIAVLPVNDPPETVGFIPEQALEEGGAPITVDLLPYFTDVDGDALTYEAVSSDETAVTVTVAGSTLTLSPVVAGMATVTVTVADVEGLTAVQTFGVAVGDRLVRGVLIDTLAGLGRGYLSSARMTLGRLLESGGGEQTRLMVAGQYVSPDAWQQMGAGGVQQSHELLFRSATLQQRGPVGDLSGTSADPRLRGPGAAGMLGGGFAGAGAGGGREQWLQGTDVLLSFGGGNDAAAEPDGGSGGRWRLWGQGDRQSFGGAPSDASAYEGDLLTGYVGMDARLSERFLAGVAVGRSGGGGDWQVGSSSGRLATELTVLYPYVRWGDRETAVWALGGIGRGTAENVRDSNGRRGTSPLSLALGLLEGRHRVAATAAGVEVHLRGEASWARLGTGAGEETVDALEAAVRRLRSGVEVTRSIRGPGGVTLAPFGAVSTRHDGGDGQTGVGLEVAGGLRLNAGRVRVEAQGRMLALHTATDYEERGMSVTATVGGAPREPGLTASLRPQWGAPGYGADSLWQDHLQSYSQETSGDDFGVDGRIGYGWRLPGGRLLRPFGGYGRTRGIQRLQMGVNLGLLGLFSGDLASPVQIEFLGERYVRPGGAEHRVSLYGVFNLN